MLGRGMPEITHGITGLHEILARDYGIEEPYWGPSLQTFLAWDIELAIIIRKQRVYGYLACEQAHFVLVSTRAGSLRGKRDVPQTRTRSRFAE